MPSNIFVRYHYERAKQPPASAFEPQSVQRTHTEAIAVNASMTQGQDGHNRPSPTQAPAVK